MGLIWSGAWYHYKTLLPWYNIFYNINYYYYIYESYFAYRFKLIIHVLMDTICKFVSLYILSFKLSLVL